MGRRWETESCKKLPNLEWTHPRGCCRATGVVGGTPGTETRQRGKLCISARLEEEVVNLPSLEWYKAGPPSFPDGMVWRGGQSAGLHVRRGS